jgi:hypothetical protein
VLITYSTDFYNFHLSKMELIQAMMTVRSSSLNLQCSGSTSLLQSINVKPFAAQMMFQGLMSVAVLGSALNFLVASAINRSRFGVTNLPHMAQFQSRKPGMMSTTSCPSFSYIWVDFRAKF